MCIELSSLQTTATSCVLSLKVELQCPPCQLPFTGQDSYGSDVLAPYHRMSGSSIYVSADSAPGARVRPPPAARSSSWDPPLSSDPSRRAGSALPGYGRRCSRVSPPSAAPPPDLGALKSAPSCSFCVWFVRSYLQGNDPRSSAYPGRAPTHRRPPARGAANGLSSRQEQVPWALSQLVAWDPPSLSCFHRPGTRSSFYAGPS